MPTENGGVSAALFAWAFLAIAVLGAGPWSLDALWGSRHAAATPAGAGLGGSTTAQTPVGQRVNS